MRENITPGPWHADYLDQHGQRVVKGEHIEIATCWHHSVGAIEREMGSQRKADLGRARFCGWHRIRTSWRRRLGGKVAAHAKEAQARWQSAVDREMETGRRYRDAIYHNAALKETPHA